MIQEVKFQGLSYSPSDHESADGELGTCLNLINEDGALHTIAQPQVTDSGISLPDGASIVFVHKVTHNNTIHSHYIAKRSDGTFCWYEWRGDGTTINLGGFSVNAVTAVGNILCFVGDTKTIYAYWKDGRYTIIDFSKIQFSGSITRTSYEVQYDTIEPNEVLADEGYTVPSLKGWNSWGFYDKLKSSVAEKIFSAQDAYLNKNMDDYSFKYIQFGVIVVKLYDGSSLVVGNPFTLAPRGAIKNKMFFYYDSYTHTLNGFYEIAGGSTYAIYYGQELDKYQMSVNIENVSLYKDLISSIDVYISNSIYPFNTKSEMKRSKTWDTTSMLSSYTANTKDGKIDQFAYQFDQDSNTWLMSASEYAFTPMTKDEMLEAINGLTFYKSTSFNIDEITSSKKKNLKAVILTSESLPLADLGRICYGAKCAITYNNRLHLGNVTASLRVKGNNGYCNLDVLSPSKSEPKEQFCGNYMDVFLTSGYAPNVLARKCSIVISARFKYNGHDAVLHDYQEDVQYPLDPMVAVPFDYASEMTYYIRTKDSKGNYIYRKRNFLLSNSDSFGFSYALNYLGNGSVCPFQVKDISLNDDTWKVTETDNSEWEESTSTEFDSQKSKVESDELFYSPNVVKVSEAENPLVFPAANSVQVGSSIISALAANTRPISEGQFGAAPLYAFTDEGVWVLMTSTTGTYDARQPTSRDICSNPSGILQIDDAILYPTERGIMMQQGREAKCITETLDGYPFDFTQLYKEEYAKKVLAIEGVSEDAVKYARFRDYLQSADMIYDYYDSRIIVFNPSYAYAYVYSIRSGMWGTMTNVFNKRVNIYPEAYATNKSGRIIDAYVRNPTDDVTYFLCSRPLSLSGSNIYKTMFSSIARGYFREAAKGKCALVLYGSNDLFHWFPIKTSVHKYLRGMAGSPYKHFRIALTGKLSPDETISSLSTEFQERWQNKLR